MSPSYAQPTVHINKSSANESAGLDLTQHLSTIFQDPPIIVMPPLFDDNSSIVKPTPRVISAETSLSKNDAKYNINFRALEKLPGGVTTFEAKREAVHAGAEVSTKVDTSNGETKVGDVSEVSEDGEVLTPKASAVTEHRIPNGNEELASTSGDPNDKFTPAVGSIAEDNTERTADGIGDAGPVENTEEARKSAYAHYVQDQIDLAEEDLRTALEDAKELRVARAMMEKNFEEELAVIEAREKELMEKLRKCRERVRKSVMIDED
ncbi:uncharacterized protein MYCFIDRAFT_200012 [Pseudocercospora fijiensis CIRAD86]|uniref:Uncharacterized protein n=1 Tax=Pseudocercospora fijiensis (strain CIRAD86) TaxID=383855 RepID=M2ZII1_PSEFD|nr:uncharacterized protein MYCFIDRAFT_200012 [Pseudocercospora fijiensis CIRAD86]EME78924.1 hypothetical protein MYCFIDRAFT_200012 [Pseudocercospora fijiensis CIRAD86]